MNRRGRLIVGVGIVGVGIVAEVAEAVLDGQRDAVGHVDVD